MNKFGKYLIILGICAFPVLVNAGLGMYEYPKLPCTVKTMRCVYEAPNYAQRDRCYDFEKDYAVVAGRGDINGGYFEFCPKDKVPLSARFKLFWDDNGQMIKIIIGVLPFSILAVLLYSNISSRLARKRDSMK